MTARKETDTGKSGYHLTKLWFDFVFESNELTRPIHTALFLWIIELNNRLQWKEVFGLPTYYSMQAIGVKGYQHYKKALDELVRWGFVVIVSKSNNQHTCNQISISLPSTLGIKQGIKQGIEQGVEQGVEQGRHSKTIETSETDKTIKKKIADAFSTDYIPSNIYEGLAYKLWKQIYDGMSGQSITPTNLLKAKASTWISNIRLMIEKDHRTEAEINEVLKFLTENDFWKGNIHSTEKLRKQFERLQTEAKKLVRKTGRTLSHQQDLSKMDYNKRP
ncbi:MAG: hypothetical protein K0M40_22515 [Prolixibacteraceae bacterium]|nr:hypothetical protein [Prolixibacteraceae bacterium]